MKITARIAFRNIVSDKKRALLIGIAIFISSFLLFLTNSTMNGVESQVLRGYVNLQSGQVIVMWEELQKVSNMDAGKFLGNNASFDITKDELNKKAFERLADFLNSNKDEIKAFYPTIRRNAKLTIKKQSTKKKESSIIIYSLIPDNRDFILSTGTLKMSEGQLLDSQEDSICISRETADRDEINIGDSVAIQATTLNKNVRSMSFVVRGIYANTAGYDNSYGFISEKRARELFGFDSAYFDVGRIYLKNSGNIHSFANRLDKYLTSESKVLRAETYTQASAFYTSTSRNIKLFFSIFTFFLLFMIGVGLRSTLRLKIFERMKEFGTLRAIGYSRIQCFEIIFFEVLFLSILALTVAFFVAFILITIFGRVGVYVGSGGVTYALGGESFYPSLNLGDIIFAYVIISLFSLISTFGPGLKLCYQTITDIMIKKQKKISLFKVVSKDILRNIGYRG
jgi:ABC-type lipoprotein release transport system permease subunit